MIRYRLSPDAEKDLDEIAAYLARVSPTTAERVVDALHEAFAFLGQHPHAGSERKDIAPAARTFSPRRPAQKYVIAFRPFDDGVEILTVVHGARGHSTSRGNG
jgi:toxin ParE1/3/4